MGRVRAAAARAGAGLAAEMVEVVGVREESGVAPGRRSAGSIASAAAVVARTMLPSRKPSICSSRQASSRRAAAAAAAAASLAPPMSSSSYRTCDSVSCCVDCGCRAEELQLPIARGWRRLT